MIGSLISAELLFFLLGVRLDSDDRYADIIYHISLLHYDHLIQKATGVF